MLGPRQAGRRHHSGSQLLDDLFPDLRIAAYVRNIQCVKRESGRKVEGSTVTLSVGEAPESVVRTAVRAANLIGDGLYGVDLKESDGQCYVMEVNDNPNVDAGNEDDILKDALYREVMGVLLRRIRDRKRTSATS